MLSAGDIEKRRRLAHFLFYWRMVGFSHSSQVVPSFHVLHNHNADIFGVSYVHGIMYGEALDDVVAGKLSEREFDLL